MTKAITFYLTTYAAWEEGQDEPTKLSTESTTEPMADVEATVAMLKLWGYTEYSSYPDWQRHGWYSPEPYIHPYSGEREERSAHLEGFTDDESRAIHAAVMGKGR